MFIRKEKGQENCSGVLLLANDVFQLVKNIANFDIFMKYREDTSAHILNKHC